jgi:chaperonin GroEL (HSP60 family)
MSRMVHAFLKGAVKMRECFCTASEAKLFAQIIAAFEAIVAVLAHNASLDSNSLTDY